MMFSLSFVEGSKSAERDPNPLADLERGGPYPLADLDRGVQILGSKSAGTPEKVQKTLEVGAAALKNQSLKLTGKMARGDE